MQARISELRQARNLLADKAMAGTVPDDIARERQTLLADQLSGAEEQLSSVIDADASMKVLIEAALDLLAACGDAYLKSEASERREWNQCWFDYIEVDASRSGVQVGKYQRTSLFDALARDEQTLGDAVDRERRRRKREGISLIRGSNFSTLVEVSGLEPPTSTLRT